MLELREDKRELVLRGDEFELGLPTTDAWEARLRVGGVPAAELFVAGTCDADGQRDVVRAVGEPRVERGGNDITIAVPAQSSLWGEVLHVFRGTPDRLEYFTRRHGIRRLDSLAIFGGWPETGDEARSRPHWDALFDPEPNACRKHYFAPTEFATIGVSSDPGYYRGNWLFTPGPLCYALRMAADLWLGAGIAARPGEHNFDHFEYVGTTTGFRLNLRYDGHVRSGGEWESPRLVLRTAKDEYAAEACYCDGLRVAGLAPKAGGKQHDWWSEPIFCGWGEQVALERRTSIDMVPPVLAADHCTQGNYEGFLAGLRRHGLNPGTVVIDDKWQRCYGLNDVDRTKWPDLRGFVAARHAESRRVLLWLRAWNPEGVPEEECLLDGQGERLAVDPSSAPYEARLRAQVRHMLNDVNADGFKIDFSHRLPTERNVRSAGGIWGIELLHRLLSMIYEEAKRAKGDALIMAHTANPYFADVVDMLRLNDMANVVGAPSYLESMRQRARVARLASPSWIIDTDNWPSPNREAWLEYCRVQPTLGVPSLYYASRLYHLGEDGTVTDEALRQEDFAEIAALWTAYRSERSLLDAR